MCYKLVKNNVSFYLSFRFPWLIQISLDHSPWFMYKYTLCCSAYICGMLVLYYQDSDLIMCMYSTFESGYAWLAINFCHIILDAHAHNVLPWWSHMTGFRSQWCPANITHFCIMCVVINIWLLDTAYIKLLPIPAL